MIKSTQLCLNKAADKTLSFLRSIMLCFLVSGILIPDNNFATVTLSLPTDLEGEPGDTLIINVDLDTGGDNIASLGAAIKATNNMLTFIDFSQGPIIPGALFSVNAVTADSIRIAFVDFGGGPITTNGVLVTLRFVLNAGIPSGQTSMLNFSELSATNPSFVNLPVVGNNGMVTCYFNTAPVLAAVTNQTMDEAASLDVPIAASDIDPDNLTLSVNNLPLFGSLTDNGDGTGTITFTPGYDDSGSYLNIEVIVTDDGIPVLSDTTAFDLTVNNVNRAPGLNPIPNQTMNEGETLGVNVASTDPDGNNISLAAENLPPFGSFVDNGDGTGIITFTPAIGNNGNFPGISVIAIDDGVPVLSDTAFFDLTVNIAAISAPSNLTADASTIDQVSLSWTDNSNNEEGFIIDRKLIGDLTFTSIDSVGNNVVSYTDTEILQGVSYHYRVIAYNISNQSDPSEVVYATSLLPAPASLSATLMGPPDMVELTWEDNSTNEEGFTLERATTYSGSYSVLASVGANVTIYYDTVTVVDTFYYRIFAFTPDTLSDNTTPIWIIPVELITFSGTVTGQSVILSWTTATETNNRGFGIERRTANTWEQIGFVEGMGTTTEKKHYQFIDDFNYSSYSGTVQYRLKQIDFSGAFEYSSEITVDVNFTPTEYALFQNYPNPFNPSTRIKFALPEKVSVRVIIYNSLGESIEVLIDGEYEAGYHETVFNASNFASGSYFYQIQAGIYSETKKMIYIK